MAWSRLVPGYIVLSLALSQITRGPGVSRLNPTKKGFSAVSWLRKRKPGASHQGGIPGAQAPVKFSTVRYEEAKELLCGLLSSEAGMSRALSEVGGAPPAQAAPSSVHEPHTEIRAQSKRANSTFMSPTKLQILISLKPHFSTYTTQPAFNLSK